ncbi:MAG: A/G-specific adenine glycosylase [Paludibacter sp.]|nr:A/G-specific adenine glycosylase [Paludibacter sp.]
MIKNKSNLFISNNLINWYNANKRDLPWRYITDPYKIWISEIILQQTRVNQGMSYYLRFIERFPTLIELAEASEDEVLKYWQGLGYYSRARNLHKAANQVVSTYGGVFPTSHTDVLKLAGIGDYTAAAICSFAYAQPYAVVDGNVYRVLSRLFGIETPIDSSTGKKEFAHLAQDLLSIDEPGTHNQAIMEFGALYCLPSSPDCINCPLNNVCKAYKLNLVSQLPIKSQKTKVTQRFFNYLFIEINGTTFLQKRTAKDVWQNLYEFPLIETDHLLNSSELIVNEDFKSLFNDIEEVNILKTTNPMKHILSHRVIFAQFISLKISNESEVLNRFIKTPISELDQFAVSRLMELFLEQIQE